jgi:hypothetical protein
VLSFIVCESIYGLRIYGRRLAQQERGLGEKKLRRHCRHSKGAPLNSRKAARRTETTTMPFRVVISSEGARGKNVLRWLKGKSYVEGAKVQWVAVVDRAGEFDK